MELQFDKKIWDCLSPVASQTRSGEQTQEVRLSDAMPDIGRVIASWGQVLLRGKEWRSGGMSVSAGVMAWVLYAPEDGSGPQIVETWIPFQLKWEFPETKHDGIMIADCLLAAVDARSVSARKLVVRASVSVMGQALEPVQAQICQAGEQDADIQLLRRNYPVKLPKEAGEKQFALEEELTVPSAAAPVAKLVRYSLQPEVIDQKIMAGKVVFRGCALVHVLYISDTGELKTLDQEVGFSQFAELDREYGADAEVRVVPAVTGLELEALEPNRLQLKAGLTGQYVVTDLSMAEVVEDAYSLTRELTPKWESLSMPSVLDERRETVRLEREQELDADRVVDTAFLAEQPRVRRDGDLLTMEMGGGFQLLYYGADGTLQGKVCNWEERMPLAADESSRFTVQLRPSGHPQAVCGGGKVSLYADVLADMVTTAEEGLPMVTGLEIGDPISSDSGRPSLILRRVGAGKLWSIAKECGATVEAIARANRLTGEPEEGQMLLIPVS